MARVVASFSAIFIASIASAQAVPIPDAAGPVQLQAAAAPPAPVPPPSPPVASPQVPVPTATTKPPSDPIASLPGPGRFVLELHDGTLLMGVFGETKAVPFEAVFGKIDVPMTSIRTVDFAAVVNGAKAHRIQFINGDMLTGKVGQIEPVNFRTSYGMVTVPMNQVLKLSSGPTTPAPAQFAAAAPSTPSANATGKRSTLPSVPIPDEPPGPVRPLRRIVPDGEVR